MTEAEFSGQAHQFAETNRVEGYNKIDPDTTRYPVSLRAEAADFLRGLVHTEVVAEVNAGNLPPEGEEDSLIVDLQRRFAMPNTNYPLSDDEVQYLKTIMKAHEKEGRLPELAEGFNPLLELDLGFSNAQAEALRRQRSQHLPEERIARKAGRVYHNLLERLKVK